MNKWFSLRLALGAIMILSTAGPGMAQESDLWGKDGEKWTPTGRLDDWSYAGYRYGEVSIPNKAVEASVKDFGAKGDGKTDDTEAFKKAVVEAAGKVIQIPKGNYVLSDRIEIRGNGTVLRGESREGTVLLFTKGLEDLYPQPVNNDGGQPTTQWSWGGGLLTITGTSLYKGASHSIKGNTGRGATSISMDTTGQIKESDVVVIIWNNDDSNSLVKMLYANDLGDASGLTGKMNRMQVNRVSRIQGTQVELVRPLRYPIQENLGCVMAKADPETMDCGIEDMTLKFDSGVYRAHFAERGFNAVAINSNALHCWVRRLHIVDSDSGIFGAGTQGTIEDITLDAKRRSLAQDGLQGHHGVDGGRDCLIQRITFESSFFHDLSVGNTNAGNVFRKIKGPNINMDQHRWGTGYNLYTDIDLGDGTRPWLSGGGTNRGKNAAAGTTFWNLRSKRAMTLPEEKFGPPPLQFIGLRVAGRDRKEAGSWWIETIAPNRLQPQDLYEAQFRKRLASGRRMSDGTANAVGAAPAEAAASGQLREWRNREGKLLQAVYGGMQGDAVILKLANGKSFTVPLSSLDDSSQKQARDLSVVPQQ